jgi:cytochrome c peroxidase
MTTSIRVRVLLLGLGLVVATPLLDGCKSEAETPNSGEREIEIQFDAQLGGARVACGKPLGLAGTNKRGVTLRDLRFFVHEVRLIGRDGGSVPLALPDDGTWQHRNVALLDFEDKSGDCKNGTPAMNAVVRGTAPPGDYTGVTFQVGVPPELSHGDTGSYRAPLTATSLYWGWLQGFIFFRLDLTMDEAPPSPSGAFEVHLGADRCDRKEGAFVCQRGNLAPVSLAAFNPVKQKVILDLDALLGDLAVADRAGEPNVPGCASGEEDPDCLPVFSAFGLDVASGSPTSTSQRAFRVGERSADDMPRGETDAGADPTLDAGKGDTGDGFDLALPKGFSPPVIPADNPLSVPKVELGRHLFYDKRLSGNQTQSCSSCHKQELAFTDSRAVGLGSTGQMHTRSSMSLANVAYSTTLTWAHPTLNRLEDQAHVPMFGEEPVELGLAGMEDELLRRLRAEPKYQSLFPAAFIGEAEPFSVANVKRAIASFERTLISGNAAFDRYLAGDDSAINESAKRGQKMFFDPNPNGSAVECFHCHGGPTFSDQLTHANQPSGEEPFHNTGLYNLDFEGSYPMGNQGIFEFTKIRNDKGRFKAPTLRNIAVTAPYMHDGSIATLEDVIAHYARGGRVIESGPNLGDGKLNRNKSEFIHGFPSATAQDRADLIEFLKTLTDQEFLTNPKFANPWP